MSPNQKSILQNSSLLEQGSDFISSLTNKLDFVNMQVLREFYATGQGFPNDTQPHIFSMLYMQMKSTQRLSVGLEAFRKRLDFLVSLGLLEKVARSNPASYHPIKGLEQPMRAVIKRFMLNNGLTHI